MKRTQGLRGTNFQFRGCSQEKPCGVPLFGGGQGPDKNPQTGKSGRKICSEHEEQSDPQGQAKRGAPQANGTRVRGLSKKKNLTSGSWEGALLGQAGWATFGSEKKARHTIMENQGGSGSGQNFIWGANRFDGRLALEKREEKKPKVGTHWTSGVNKGESSFPIHKERAVDVSLSESWDKPTGVLCP